MVYHDHATQRLSQQFGIYCIVATGCLGLYSCVNPSNTNLNSSNFSTSLIKHLNATIRINFSFLLDWLKPPNTKMKRMIRDFRITNVLRHDFGVFLLIKYWCLPDAWCIPSSQICLSSTTKESGELMEKELWYQWNAEGRWSS